MRILPEEYILSKSFLLFILSFKERLFCFKNYCFSLLTVKFFLPLALLLASTFLPFLVFILSRKPCLFLLFLLLGWYVLFIRDLCFLILAKFIRYKNTKYYLFAQGDWHFKIFPSFLIKLICTDK